MTAREKHTDVFRALSWGCGLQSTALAVMSVLGRVPPFDLIVHADTGWERAETYEVREFYESWLRDRGATVKVVTAGNIREQGLNEHIHMPLFTDNGGPLRRQCTRHFKIIPCKRAIRKAAGYHPTKPPHPPAGSIELSLGITTDEYQRMKTSRVKFIKHRYPLCMDLMFSRVDCERYLRDLSLPVPVKSSCIGCPYRSNKEWVAMRDESPDEFQDAVDFDEDCRDHKLDKQTATKLYVHNQRIPLREAKHAEEEPGLLFCESGYCHI